MYPRTAMSATPSPDIEATKEHCQPEDVRPVRLEAAGLESTAPEYLRDLKRELASDGLYPAGLEVEVRFDEDCTLATQDEADRLRSYVRAAAFLGVGRVTVRVEEVADESKVEPALAACAERARREGVLLDVERSTD
jgi:sugar phosphate isomerase/epimerase